MLARTCRACCSTVAVSDNLALLALLMAVEHATCQPRVLTRDNCYCLPTILGPRFGELGSAACQSVVCWTLYPGPDAPIHWGPTFHATHTPFSCSSPSPSSPSPPSVVGSTLLEWPLLGAERHPKQTLAHRATLVGLVVPDGDHAIFARDTKVRVVWDAELRDPRQDGAHLLEPPLWTRRRGLPTKVRVFCFADGAHIRTLHSGTVNWWTDSD